jgi:hypothetical protein
MKMVQMIKNPEKSTHSKELSPPSEAGSHSAGQEIPHRSWSPKIQ